MKLLLKILKGSLNFGQLVSFTLANVVGLTVLILGIYVSTQLKSVLSDDGDLFSEEYLVISKPVSSLGTIAAAIANKGPRSFSENEIDEIGAIDGVVDLAPFTPSSFSIYGSAKLSGFSIGTEMFLESVPERFLDEEVAGWDEPFDGSYVPIIVPRTYLDFYNYGFAVSSGLPQISGQIISSIKAEIEISGNGKSETYPCRVAGFSDRLNSILVPKGFQDEANKRFGNGEQQDPVRLILKTDPKKTADVALQIDQKGYVLTSGSPMNSKMSSALRSALAGVMGVGFLLAGISFLFLLVSILLLMEKNRDKIVLLSDLGYPSKEIAFPFQMVSIVADVVSMLFSVVLCVLLQPLINDVFVRFNNDYSAPGFLAIALPALGLLLLFGTLHYFAVLMYCRTDKK